MMQLTHDDTEKVTVDGPSGERLVTDGTRIYYEDLGHTRSLLKEVSTEGGESEDVQFPLPNHQAVDLRAPSELLALGDPVNATLVQGGVWHMTFPGQRRYLVARRQLDLLDIRTGHFHNTCGHKRYAPDSNG
jgi:hypothetical protein